MAAKQAKKETSLLHTTISEMTVNDLPIDALTRESVNSARPGKDRQHK